MTEELKELKLKHMKAAEVSKIESGINRKEQKIKMMSVLLSLNVFFSNYGSLDRFLDSYTQLFNFSTDLH